MCSIERRRTGRASPASSHRLVLIVGGLLPLACLLFGLATT